MLIESTEVISTTFMWFVFTLFALDVDRVAPVAFGKIQKFVDSSDIGDTVGHFKIHSCSK